MEYIYVLIIIVLISSLYEYVEYTSIKHEAIRNHTDIKDYIRTTLDYSDATYDYDLWGSK